MPAYLVGAIVWSAWSANLGLEIFPPSMPAGSASACEHPTALAIEETEKLANQALAIITNEAGPENVEISLGYVGRETVGYPINTIHLWTGGPEEAILRVQSSESGIRYPRIEERLRTACLHTPRSAASLRAG